MKLHIVARGKIGRCPEADLIERYAKRVTWPFQITELPDTGGKQPPIAPGTVIVAMDETGEQLTSSAFAKKIEHWRDTGTRELRFLIGAADGLTAEERASASLFIAFGKATWPHMLAAPCWWNNCTAPRASLPGIPITGRGERAPSPKTTPSSRA